MSAVPKRVGTKILLSNFINALSLYINRLHEEMNDARPLAPVMKIADARPPKVKKPVPTWLKLHGKYMGTIRSLTPKQKARVKAIQQRDGYKVAIAAAQKMRK